MKRQHRAPYKIHQISLVAWFRPDPLGSLPHSPDRLAVARAAEEEKGMGRKREYGKRDGGEKEKIV